MPPQSPAYNVHHESLHDLVERIRAISPELGEHAPQELLREIRVAPTLVKYANPSTYEIETRRELRQVASELMGNVADRSGSLGRSCSMTNRSKSNWRQR